MSKHTHRFPSFYNSLISPKKYIYALLACPYPNDSHKAVFVFHSKMTHTCQLPAPTLPLSISLSLSLSPYLSITRSNPRCGFLEYVSGPISSWCSASQLLLALTQTTTS
ncbi:unnamed protein product [Hymenolepis diminuta]|uniref:Uncharacterized protein n=1 Tax=Hymenolepis diminuta TaxID=6216 RepID=A0A564YWK7_HYMDI|nr:unnamed protein product [Hymenolepis diminuta]